MHETLDSVPSTTETRIGHTHLQSYPSEGGGQGNRNCHPLPHSKLEDNLDNCLKQSSNDNIDRMCAGLRSCLGSGFRPLVEHSATWQLQVPGELLFPCVVRE